MTESMVTVGVGAIAAYLGKDGIQRILGPTADYLGGELKEFTKKRIENVAKIFSNAERKLGEKLDKPGRVPPKVLKTVINEGSYSEDKIAIEYFGGVLASSRTEIGRDDRGSRLAQITDNLSVYQLRSHYLIYSTISVLFSNSNHKFQLDSDRRKMQIFIPIGDYFHAMEFTQEEWGNLQILPHIFHGLSSEGLIEGLWQFGNKESLQQKTKKAHSDGIIVSPSALGVELLLWAFGHGDKQLEFLLSDGFSPDIEGISTVPNGVATKG